MSKRLLAQELFKSLNLSLNVEYEQDEYPRLVIGGLTPKWYVEERSHNKFYITRVKWVNGSFKGLKPYTVSNFRAALLFLVYKEAAENLSLITSSIVSGELQDHPRRSKHFFRRSK